MVEKSKKTTVDQKKINSAGAAPAAPSATRRAYAIGCIFGIYALCFAWPLQATVKDPSLIKNLRRETSVLRLLVEFNRAVLQSQQELEDHEFLLKQINYQISEANRRIKALSQKIDQHRKAIRMRARSIYKLSQGGFLRLLLDNSDGKNLTRSLSATRLIMRRDAREKQLYQKELAALNSEREELDRKRVKYLELKKQWKQKFEESKAAQRKQLQILHLLHKHLDLQSRLGDELNLQEQRLARRIKILEHRVRFGGGFATQRGRLHPPVIGAVAGTFGRTPLQGERIDVFRNGLTFHTAKHAEVHAVYYGRVRLVSQLSGFGQIVLIEHRGGYFTLYGMLTNITVTVGKRVNRGTPIGRAGNDPLTGKHAVYFEIRRQERALDPTPWLRL